MKKLIIVWLCHFTNAEIQAYLPVWKRKDEFALWVPNTLKGFENKKDFEIHVISPHEYLRRDTNIILRNIHYHFIAYGIPLWHRHWPSFFKFDIFTNFWFFRRDVKKIINKIDPSLINLIGAENAYYSSAILDYKNVKPVIVCIQGFIGPLKEIRNKSRELKKRIEIEEIILREFKYFYGEQDSSTYISNYNPNHQFFRLYFQINEELASSTQEQVKKFDCIYYGRLSKLKGTEDFIKVISELKNKKPNIKACIAGGGDQFLFMEIAKELNCRQNIEFVGFLKTQKELFEHIKASKVFLAPPHQERLSATIREAMFLKIPIVAYATGGIPYINEFSENIYMVETGDYKAMAEKTLQLLNDDKARQNLAEKAYEYALNEFSLAINNQRLISAYHEILKK
jgi:glycosyltransferase involved in cell wall biosynthesis